MNLQEFKHFAKEHFDCTLQRAIVKSYDPLLEEEYSTAHYYLVNSKNLVISFDLQIMPYDSTVETRIIDNLLSQVNTFKTQQIVFENKNYIVCYEEFNYKLENECVVCTKNIISINLVKMDIILETLDIEHPEQRHLEQYCYNILK